MRVAYLHGFAGDPSAWRDIASDDAVVLPLPGHGIAVLPTWADNIAAAAAAIGTVDAVVGYSLGARVALGLVAAGHAPRAILISVNPGIADSERSPRRAADAAWATLLRTSGMPAFLDAWEAQPLFATQQRVEPRRLAERRARRLALDPAQLARSLEVMGLAEMPDYRAAVDARCHLIAGADDAKFVAIAHTVDAPLDVIPACGHDPTLEQPAALTQLIAGILS